MKSMCGTVTNWLNTAECVAWGYSGQKHEQLHTPA